MTGSMRSSEGLDPRRRRLLFQSWHRGIREMDLIMGRFADAHIDKLAPAELDEYERLVLLPEPQLYACISGEVPVQAKYDTPLFRKLRDFKADGRNTR